MNHEQSSLLCCFPGNSLIFKKNINLICFQPLHYIGVPLPQHHLTMGKGNTLVERTKSESVRVRHDSLNDIRDMETLMAEFGGEIQVPIIKGDVDALPSAVKAFVAENVRLCRPKGVYICDGSEDEAEEITEKMVNRGLLTKLDKYDNWWVYKH